MTLFKMYIEVCIGILALHNGVFTTSNHRITLSKHLERYIVQLMLSLDNQTARLDNQSARLWARPGPFGRSRTDCTRTEPGNELWWSDRLITGLKFSQGFLPCLVYGVYAWFLISHFEVVEEFEVRLYYLYKEEENSRY